MSKARRLQKARKRRAHWATRNWGPKSIAPCSHCGEPGPHFVPPSLGDPGFFICAAPSDVPEQP